MHHGILTGNQDGGYTVDGIDDCADVVGNSCNLTNDQTNLSFIEIARIE